MGLALAAVLCGVIVGSIGAFVQAARVVWSVAGTVIALPWGLVLVLVMLLILIRGVGGLLGSRGGSWAVLAGWLGSTVLFAIETSSGDVAIGAGGRQWLYVLGGTILGAAASTIPVRRWARRAPFAPSE